MFSFIYFSFPTMNEFKTKTNTEKQKSEICKIFRSFFSIAILNIGDPDRLNSIFLLMQYNKVKM